MPVREEGSGVALATLPAPGLLRRMGAILYDSALLLGVLAAGAAAEDLVLGWLGQQVDPQHPLHRLYLLGWVVLFFGYFWVHGGQTLGMMAWRIRVVREGGGALKWRDAMWRLALSLLSWLPLGLGFLWSLIPPDRRAWHDRGSGTRLVVLPKG